MAAGCPVVACDDAVPRPLTRPALTFPARDAARCARGSNGSSTDEGLRARAINSGEKSARELTWDRCARATADVYREVLEED